MKFAVMGAGAVGCYYGGMLARAGHEVVLIGRPTHVEAVQRHGLRLQAQTFDEQVSLQAATEAAAVAGADVVLCCVKSPDTEDAAAAMRPHLAPGTLVLSLQNGVDNAERLRGVLAQEVLPAVVYVATEMAGPGHVRHHGRGELVIGPSARSAALAEVFGAAGVPVQVSDNVAGALWAKLILNCAYNALSAIAQLPYGRLVQGKGIGEVMRDVVDECLAVARAEGVALMGDAHEAVRQLAGTMPAQYSSTAQGLVVRRGEARGVATPVNRTLWALVKLIEAGAVRA
jgi:2-dehydropantoate 2-reductase